MANDWEQLFLSWVKSLMLPLRINQCWQQVVVIVQHHSDACKQRSVIHGLRVIMKRWLGEWSAWMRLTLVLYIMIRAPDNRYFLTLSMTNMEAMLTVWPCPPLQHDVYGVDGAGWGVGTNAIRSRSRHRCLKQLPERCEELRLWEEGAGLKWWPGDGPNDGQHLQT